MPRLSPPERPRSLDDMPRPPRAPSPSPLRRGPGGLKEPAPERSRLSRRGCRVIPDLIANGFCNGDRRSLESTWPRRRDLPPGSPSCLHPGDRLGVRSARCPTLPATDLPLPPPCSGSLPRRRRPTAGARPTPWPSARRGGMSPRPPRRWSASPAALSPPRSLSCTIRSLEHTLQLRLALLPPSSLCNDPEQSLDPSECDATASTLPTPAAVVAEAAAPDRRQNDAAVAAGFADDDVPMPGAIASKAFFGGAALDSTPGGALPRNLPALFDIALPALFEAAVRRARRASRCAASLRFFMAAGSGRRRPGNARRPCTALSVAAKPATNGILPEEKISCKSS
mmetsp:Transcript_62567/g.179963  ORF Transcript_62567/g.179963 Transcript_62567/m.179963 type:complete len:340 (-) Transcript_62567:1279-2298(-)